MRFHPDKRDCRRVGEQGCLARPIARTVDGDVLILHAAGFFGRSGFIAGLNRDIHSANG